MKKKFPVMGFLIGVLLALVATLSSCEQCSTLTMPATTSDEVSDSVLVAQYIDRVVNPKFISVSEVVNFREKALISAETDSVFLGIPKETLVNVSSVVIKQFGTASKQQIVNEFQRNRAVYENLPNKAETTPSNIQPKETAQVEDVPATTVDKQESSVFFNIRDTVINGKKGKVEQKVTLYD